MDKHREKRNTAISAILEVAIFALFGVEAYADNCLTVYLIGGCASLPFGIIIAKGTCSGNDECAKLRPDNINNAKYSNILQRYDKKLVFHIVFVTILLIGILILALNMEVEFTESFDYWFNVLVYSLLGFLVSLFFPSQYMCIRCLYFR